MSALVLSLISIGVVLVYIIIGVGMTVIYISWIDDSIEGDNILESAMIMAWFIVFPVFTLMTYSKRMVSWLHEKLEDLE